MLDGDDIFEVTRIAQGCNDQNQHTETAQGGAGEDVDAPHGREPVIIEAHEPIDGGEGEAHSEEGQAAEGDLAVEKCVFRGTRSVLFDGISAKPEAGYGEENEVKSRTNPEEFFGEIRPFLI